MHCITPQAVPHRAVGPEGWRWGVDPQLGPAHPSPSHRAGGVGLDSDSRVSAWEFPPPEGRAGKEQRFDLAALEDQVLRFDHLF